MRKITVNNITTAIRTLSPFAYKDTIKTLEKSNQARVTLDGVKVRKSAVTKGRDVKAYSGMKYHLYFYPTTGEREWMPITAEEYRAYTEDPGFSFDIVTVKAEQPEQTPEQPPEQPAAPAGEQTPEQQPADEQPAPQPEGTEQAAAEQPAPAAEQPAPAAEQPTTRKGRKAAREAAAAEAATA